MNENQDVRWGLFMIYVFVCCCCCFTVECNFNVTYNTNNIDAYILSHISNLIPFIYMLYNILHLPHENDWVLIFNRTMQFIVHPISLYFIILLILTLHFFLFFIFNLFSFRALYVHLS